MKNNQNGFGALGILLIIVIVGLVGFGGWYVWHQRENKTADASKTTQSNEESTEKNEQKYLSVKELGVKLPLTASIADANYAVSTSSQDENGKPTTVWLGLTSLDTVCSAAEANRGGKPLAGIMKVQPTDTDPVSGELYTQKYPGGVTIEGYYYAYLDWVSGNPCTTDTAYQAQLKDANTAFAAAVKQMVAE